MLQQTRFASHFEFIGSFQRHYGLFEGCGSAIPFDRFTSSQAQDSVGGCC
jgi:arsenite methyltransferase